LRTYKCRQIAQQRSRETHRRNKIERLRDKLIETFKELDEKADLVKAEELDELKETDEIIITDLMSELEDLKDNLQKKDEEIRQLSYWRKPSHLQK
jgi:glutamine synthetase type III